LAAISERETARERAARRCWSVAGGGVGVGVVTMSRQPAATTDQRRRDRCWLDWQRTPLGRLEKAETAVALDGCSRSRSSSGRRQTDAVGGE